MITDTDATDDSTPVVADESAPPGNVLTLAQAADRLHLPPSLLRRLMRHGSLLPDERAADGQLGFRAATLDLYAAQRSTARSTLGPTLRRQFARVLKKPGQPRVAPTEKTSGRFTPWSSRGARRGATLWRLREAQRWREQRMQRLYTL